jgi:hypothetical protein
MSPLNYFLLNWKTSHNYEWRSPVYTFQNFILGGFNMTDVRIFGIKTICMELMQEAEML